jgi:hypothetical protein
MLNGLMTGPLGAALIQSTAAALSGTWLMRRIGTTHAATQRLRVL